MLAHAWYQAVDTLMKTGDMNEVQTIFRNTVDRIHQLLDAAGYEGKITIDFKRIKHTELRHFKGILVQIARNASVNDGYIPLIPMSLSEGISSSVGQTSMPRYEIAVKQAYNSISSVLLYQLENYGTAGIWPKTKRMYDSYWLFGGYGEATHANVAMVDFTAFQIEDAVLFVTDDGERVSLRKLLLDTAKTGKDKLIGSKLNELKQQILSFIHQGLAPIITFKTLELGSNISTITIRNFYILKNGNLEYITTETSLPELLHDTTIDGIIINKKAEIRVDCEKIDVTSKLEGFVTGVIKTGAKYQLMVTGVYDPTIMKFALAPSGQKGQAGSIRPTYYNILAAIYEAQLSDSPTEQQIQELYEKMMHEMEITAKERTYKFEIDLEAFYGEVLKELKQKAKDASDPGI